MSDAEATAMEAAGAQLMAAVPSRTATRSDRFEPDDSTQTAHVLIPQASPEVHTLYPASDVDWVAVDITSTPRYVDVGAHYGTDVTGYAADGRFVASSSGGGATGDEGDFDSSRLVVGNGLLHQRFYLRVSASSPEGVAFYYGVQLE